MKAKILLIFIIIFIILFSTNVFATTNQYNQTQTINITGTNITSPDNLNVIDGQTYNVTEAVVTSGVVQTYNWTSSDNETGTQRFNTTSSGSGECIGSLACSVYGTEATCGNCSQCEWGEPTAFLNMSLVTTYQGNTGAGSIEGAFGMQADSARKLLFISATTDDYITILNYSNPASITTFGDGYTDSSPPQSIDGILRGFLNTTEYLFIAPGGTDSVTSWFNVSTTTVTFLGNTTADTSGAGIQTGEYDTIEVFTGSNRWLLTGTDGYISVFLLNTLTAPPLVNSSITDTSSGCSIDGLRDMYNIPGTAYVLVAATTDDYLTTEQVAANGAITCAGSYTDATSDNSIDGLQDIKYETDTKLVYTTSPTDGYMSIINATVPATLAAVGSVGGLTAPISVSNPITIAGTKYVFVGSSTNSVGIVVINVTTPSAPTIVTTFTDGGACSYNVVNDLYAEGNYLYATSGVDYCFYSIKLYDIPVAGCSNKAGGACSECAATSECNGNCSSAGCSIDTIIPSTEYNSSWTSAYSGIGGNDYQNVDKMGAIITISTYNPAGSNTTYDNNIRPDIEVGFYNGTAYVNDSYCYTNTTMGMNLQNNTAWNCSINTTATDIRNAWMFTGNRSLIIRGIWLDAYNSTIYDEINVTGVYGYVDGWNTTAATYRAEIEHNATVSYSGTLNSVNVSVNFTTNVTSVLNLTIYNFNSGSWNYTTCQNGTATANTWYNWWCNVTTSPSYYNSSNGEIRVRLNGTVDHSDLAMIREDYVQYYVTFISLYYATGTDYATYSDLQSGYKAVTISKAESTSFSDILAKLSNFFEVRTDSLTYGEILSKSGIFAKPLTDSITYGELISLFRLSSVSKTDSLTYGEILTKLGLFSMSKTDSLVYYELLLKLGFFGKSLNDTITYGELISAWKIITTSATSSITYYDLLLNIGFFYKKPTDYATYNDLLTKLGLFSKPLTNSITYGGIIYKFGIFPRIRTDSLTYGELLYKLGLISISKADSATYNEIIAKIGLLYKNPTDSITYGELLSKLQSLMKSSTDSATYSDLISKLGIYGKSKTDSITYSELLSRIDSFFISRADSAIYYDLLAKLGLFGKGLNDYITYGELITKLGLSYKSQTDSITYYDLLSKLGILTITQTSYLSYSDITTRLQNLFKSLTDLASYSESISRFSILFKSPSDSLIYIESIITQKISGVVKTVVDFVTYSDVSGKTTLMFKSLTSYFTYSESYTRIAGLFRYLSDYSTYSDLISRFMIGIRLLTSSSTYNEQLSNLFQYFKSIISSSTYTESIIRLSTFFKSLTDLSSYNESLTVFSIRIRTLTSFVSYSEQTSKFSSFFKLLSDLLSYIENVIVIVPSAAQTYLINQTSSMSYSELTTMVSSFFKSLTQSTSYNEIATKLSTFLKGLTDYSTYSELLTKLGLFGQYPTSYLTYSESSLRLQSLFKSLSDYSAYNDLINKFPIRISSLFDYLTYSESAIRLQSLFKSLSDYFIYSESVSRLAEFIKASTSYLSYSEITGRIRILSKDISDLLNISEISIKVRSLTIIVSDFSTYGEAITRLSEFFRTVSDILSFKDWIRFFRFYYVVDCTLITDSDTCTFVGCNWCNNACQLAACPSPAPPSGVGGGGGGFWIPSPISVAPKETILDTTVHVETPQVNPGDKVYAIITLMKVQGPQGVMNVNISYWIKDLSGNILGMKQTVVGVETIRSDIYYLVVPISAPLGTYTFQALAQYNNATDTSFDNFQVTTAVAKPSIAIKRIDVPFILAGENTSIKVILENLENRKIDLNITLLLPYEFIPQNITKLLSLEPLSEDVIEFTFIPKKPGSFSGFIKIEYEDKKIIRDFDIEVYSTEKFFTFLIGNYWWIIALALIALLAFFIYKTKDRFKRKEKVKYVFERKELLPKI